ncbi:hypothetical protein BC939DRAFT_512541 [Gamsiella multidivaricata]|uniref:uncharacterized protein n=1 Tax=Gamsiella multidivaricata TaxID=101098 RepID=UPI00221F4D29|nr:uncharacterized protein BC939DRAFT_512541 [Gamsiella multidivaricata]KAI7815930.1 hypothetical protein BC939DRAFT_512541 [Gamsiella multidivaricata]
MAAVIAVVSSGFFLYSKGCNSRSSITMQQQLLVFLLLLLISIPLTLSLKQFFLHPLLLLVNLLVTFLTAFVLSLTTLISIHHVLQIVRSRRGSRVESEVYSMIDYCLILRLKGSYILDTVVLECSRN